MANTETAPPAQPEDELEFNSDMEREILENMRKGNSEKSPALTLSQTAKQASIGSTSSVSADDAPVTLPSGVERKAAGRQRPYNEAEDQGSGEQENSKRQRTIGPTPTAEEAHKQEDVNSSQLIGNRIGLELQKGGAVPLPSQASDQSEEQHKVPPISRTSWCSKGLQLMFLAGTFVAGVYCEKCGMMEKIPQILNLNPGN